MVHRCFTRTLRVVFEQQVELFLVLFLPRSDCQGSLLVYSLSAVSIHRPAQGRARTNGRRRQTPGPSNGTGTWTLKRLLDLFPQLRIFSRIWLHRRDSGGVYLKRLVMARDGRVIDLCILDERRLIFDLLAELVRVVSVVATVLMPPAICI